MSQHLATFTWGVGPQTVYVAGGFNNWSGNATPLHKQPDGSFSAQVPMPWGEKQAFKYVVDDEWKVREDEAKEWDAAGNMNNVYTAPPAPISEHSTAAPTHSEPTSVPPATTSDESAPVAKETEPSALLAASAPPAASSGNPYVLGAISGNAAHSEVPASSAVFDETSTPAAPVAAVAADPDIKPTPEVMEKTAAAAPIGEATPATNSTEEAGQSIAAQATAYGAAALGALGAIAGSAAVVVEKATGVDLTHSQPISVDEAKAQGIDINSLPKVDATTDTTSPAGTTYPASAVDALEEKVQQLKVDSSASATGLSAVPLPNGSAPQTSSEPSVLNKVERDSEAPSHDIPAQPDTTANHTHVPMPVITNIGEKDASKDRSLDAVENRDTAGTKPIDDNPTVSAKAAKEVAETYPVATGSTAAATTGTEPTPSTPGAAVPVAVTTAPEVPSKESSPIAATAPTTTTAAPPSTPYKNGIPVIGSSTPGSAVSTPASTPAKSTHGRETSSGSDVRKRKSSFFAKIKTVFKSPSSDKSK